MDRLEYIPIKQFSEHLAKGWTLACELKPGDYAAVMCPPRPMMNNKQWAAQESVRQSRKKRAGVAAW